MSYSTRRQLAMLAAEEGELAQAEQDLTLLIDTLKHQLLSTAGKPDPTNAYNLCTCLQGRAIVRSWAVKLPEAMQDLEQALLLANQQKPLNRRILRIGVLQDKARLLSTAFSPLYDPCLARTTLIALRAEEPEEWMMATVELRLAQQQQDWQGVIVQTDIIIASLGPRGLVRGVNAARNAAARAWLELGQPKLAEPLAEQSWAFFKENGPPDAAAQAALALARGRGRSEDWPLVEQALSLTEQLTRAQRNLFDQQRYLVEKLQVYGDALRFALHLAETAFSGDARRIAVTCAWQVAERSKSFSLRQAMTQGGWLQVLDPQSAAELAKVEKQMDALEAQHNIREAADELSKLSAKRSKIIEATMAQNPLFAQVQVAPPFSLQAVLDALPVGVGVISWYWLTASDNWQLHIFYASTDREPQHISTFWTANEVATVNNARQDSAKQHPFLVGQPLPAPLADKVFPPQLLTTLTDCHTLLLTPHSHLRQMPLHAAQITNVAPSNDATCLLIERFAVQVLPTLALPFPAQAELPNNAWRVLLMGCEQDGYRHKRLVDIPLELKRLHDAWSVLGHSVSTHLLSPDARLDEYAPLSRWSQFDLIHLACHGSFVPEHPLDATLYLGSEALRATEFFTTRLNTQVICLSACDVGQHNDTLDDGLKLINDEWLGLALPLFQSGTRAVLASLWQAEDKIACAFMQTFHHALTQDVTTARAHQLACLSQIKERFGFWASWQLAGFPN